MALLQIRSLENEGQMRINVKKQKIRKPLDQGSKWQLTQNRETNGERILTLSPICTLQEELLSDAKALEERGKAAGSLGEIVARTLLENQYLIPKKWEKSIIVFSGTKWKDENGNIKVPILIHDGREWVLMYAPMNGKFYQTAKFAILTK